MHPQATGWMKLQWQCRYVGTYSTRGSAGWVALANVEISTSTFIIRPYETWNFDAWPLLMLCFSSRSINNECWKQHFEA